MACPAAEENKGEAASVRLQILGYSSRLQLPDLEYIQDNFVLPSLAPVFLVTWDVSPSAIRYFDTEWRQLTT